MAVVIQRFKEHKIIFRKQRCLYTSIVQMSIFASMQRILFFLLFVFSFVPATLYAQDKDEQLAAQYLSNGEFEKAADAYEKLINKTPSSGYYYDNLMSCYFKLNRFEDAEKLTKKQQRRFSDNYYFQVDQGYVYVKANAPDKAKKLWDELLSKVSGEELQANEMASAFQKRGETDYAINVYVKARKKSNSPFLYCFELARLYADKKETQLMVNEYLNALQSSPMLQEDIEGYLQLYLEKNEDYELVKNSLIKRYRENPDNDVFSEMLVWLYVQRKDFNSAFMQARAIDKRYKEDGRRVLELAYLSLQNEYYDEATTMFNYIIGLGKDKPHYMNARIGSMDARNKKVINTTQYTAADLKLLESDYKAFLEEFGRYYYTAAVIRDLARLQAYYLNDYAGAVEQFNELINMQRLDNQFKANSKLELGDIYLLKGEEWDAMLLYGQVDKDFKEDPLGQEAKFRNAKLSYYLGEFEWARAQLDVLKTATTQLIANNALELSLLIQDNTLDSIEEPLLIFAKADLNYFQNKTDLAIQLLDSIDREFPRHTLADDILFKRAEISYKKREFAQSVKYLQQLLNEHGSDILGDNALFMLADITEKKLNDKPAAQKLYEEFLEKYPGSFFTVEVRKRFRALRGDVVN
jgi:predicted Zn-dependent protease